MRERIWKEMRSIYPKSVFTELNVSKIYASIESSPTIQYLYLVLFTTNQIVVSVSENCQVFIGAKLRAGGGTRTFHPTCGPVFVEIWENS